MQTHKARCKTADKWLSDCHSWRPFSTSMECIHLRKLEKKCLHQWMHQFSSLHHNLASSSSAERHEGVVLEWGKRKGKEGGSQADRNSKKNFAQETYGTNLQVGLGHCCHVSHTGMSEKEKKTFTTRLDCLSVPILTNTLKINS